MDIESIRRAIAVERAVYEEGGCGIGIIEEAEFLLAEIDRLTAELAAIKERVCGECLLYRTVDCEVEKLGAEEPTLDFPACGYWEE